MKRIIIFCSLSILATNAIGMISPLDMKLNRAKKEYQENKIECPDDKPLYVDGGCLACDEYENWDDVAAVFGCEKCSNSHQCFGNHCCINCPDERPVMLSNAACVACDYEPKDDAPIYDIVKGCEKCVNIGGELCKNVILQSVPSSENTDY